MTGRSERQHETRERQERKKQWVNPKQLLDPDPRPGLVHRWIRTSMLGRSDARNVSMKFREGWEPCKASDYPEFKEFANESNDQIEYGGLILCRMDESLVKQRNEYFEKIARDQLRAVDNNMMRENDPRMPLLQPERQQTFGS